MLTVRYALTREELRGWYKVMWRRKLWMFHAAILALSSGAFALAGTGGSTRSGLIFGAALGVGVIAFMVIWPQLRYRPEERTLTFDEDGLSFERGAQTGRMPWSQIVSVANTDSGLVITGRSQSAFIVPTRAFGGEAAQGEAFRTVSDLYRQASR